MQRLIAIATCHNPKFVARAQGQRDTWVPTVTGADVRFFYGRENFPGGTIAYETSDSSILDVDDSYEGLPEKVRAICRYAVANSYDYLFKTDDDAYIVPDVLLNECEVAPHDYVGNTRVHTSVAYNSGYAYWLSRRAMEVIANAELTDDTFEDRWVGSTLLASRIRPVRDSFHYRIVYPGFEEPEIIWSMNSAIGHAALFAQFPPKQMYMAHKAYSRTGAYWKSCHARIPVELERQ